MLSTSSVKVAVRLRPMNKKEEMQGTLPVVNASSVDNTITAIKGNGRGQQRSSFNFDNVFSSYTTQEQVFESTLKPVINDVLQGFESTVFAYGQTGTGKTHTMEGNLSNPDQYGVIPRAAESIFEVLNRPEYISHSIVVSYLEIYNEELCDLLSDEAHIPPKGSPRKSINKLEIFSGKDGVVCRGLTERTVESAADVLAVMNKAQQHRKIGETKMNKQSSRSHCVFTMRLRAKKRLGDGNIFDTRGKLHLVDLAGSECAKSAAIDRIGIPRGDRSIGSHDSRDEISRERGRERSNINRSLLTLGRVIIMLKEQSQSKHPQNVRIPYRDSKLTRILQDALGGRCKTVVIATVSPSVLSIEETMSTLNYAQSASGIINKPVAVSYLSVNSGASRTVSSADTNDIKSVEHWQEMEMRMEYLQSQVEEAQAALARQYREQKGIIDRAEKAEEELIGTKERLEISEYSLKKSNAILKATRATEARLTEEANELMNKLGISIMDGDELHGLLLKSSETDYQRREATKRFHSAVLEHVSLVKDKLIKLKEEGDTHHSNTVSVAEKRVAEEHEELNESVQLLHEIQLHVSDLTMTMKSHVQDENGILDVLSKLTENIQGNVQEAKKLIHTGEEDLVMSIDNTRRDLRMHSESLLEMEKVYNTTSEDVVKKMDSLITETNEKVTNMVSSAVGALIQARIDSSETRISLSETLATFHDVSSSSVAHIQEESQKCSDQLTKSIINFSTGMKHLDRIQEELDNQRTMMNTKGVAHVAEIDEQRNLVMTQSDDISNAKFEQKRLEKAFVEQVLKGVTDLVTEQMSLMSTKHEEHLTIVEQRNQALGTLTDGVKSSANDILSDTKSANKSIQEHSNESRLNDEMMKTNGERANDVLKDIEKIASKQRDIETDFVDLINAKTDKLMKHEDAVGAATSTLKNDSISARKFVAEHVDSELKASVSQLSDIANKQTNYARGTALASTTNQLEESMQPRVSLMSEFTSATDTVLRSATEGRGKIEKIGDKQCETADELRSDVEMKYDGFGNNVAKRRRSAIDDRKKVVVDNSDEFNKFSNETLKSTVEVTSKTSNSVNDFATNTMKFEEEVPPIAERKRIEYDPTLSSTPAEEIIVKDIVAPEME
jgi:hypothetical protein